MSRPDPHDVGRLWVEEGEGGSGTVAVVAPVRRLDRLYSFAVPAPMAEQLRVGQRVQVPLGRSGKPAVAFVIEITNQAWKRSLKTLDAVLEEEPCLSPELLELGKWIARYYCCPLGPALAAMVPRAVRDRSGFIAQEFVQLARPLDEILTEAPRIGRKSRALLQTLSDAAPPHDADAVLHQIGAGRAVLRAAVAKGWVRLETVRAPGPPPTLDVPRQEPGYELTNEQRTALEAIAPAVETGGFQVALLYGVSGSGKTEVYVRAMRRAVETGRQAIMLVPEIALTTQLVGRLAARFDRVAVIHSGLGDAARSRYWQAIARGEIAVVIGTRSAVFAPCPRLGLIVVDEEQESSYKNLAAPRFHVRDVAVKRAQLAGIPVLLGSATPSLETWWNCQRIPHYRRLDLPRRVRDLPLPEMTLVQTSATDNFAEAPALSPLLEERLGQTMARKEQAVLLVNRRGFAWSIRCPSCGWRAVCPQCNALMVFHAATASAVCHHCGGRVSVPIQCPVLACGARLARIGAGTQRVESELRTRFPAARIARADSDELRRADEYQRLVDQFAAREIDILVGTQMIAKGLDFPYVSLVGVIAADLTSTSDFRAAERLFQLVTQVGGRAGRAETRGEVVVQSSTPEAPALRAALAHDFEAFVDAELEVRRRMNFPPCSRLARFICADASETRARTAADALVEAVRKRLTELGAAGHHGQILGPQPCSMRRLRNQYRYEALIRAPSGAELQKILEDLRSQKLLRPGVKSFTIDVDPVAFN